jgi:hypothetical protein
MIVMKISDGLGNQMFQYALGRKLSIKHDCELKFDTDWYENREKHGGTDRELTINQFNLHFERASEQDITSIVPFWGLARHVTNKYIPVANTTISKIFPKEVGKIFNYYCEKRNHKNDKTTWPHRRQFGSAILDIDHGYLEGYWQTPKYFTDIRDTLREDFSIRAEQRYSNLVDRIGDSTAVGVHIRRGDFIHQGPGHGNVLPQMYYDKSISHIQSNNTDIELFVFSDEPAWARNHRTFDFPTTHVSDSYPTSEVEDVYLMSLCNHNIMANSTFSWWSAWLNNNSKKRVTVPTPWKPKASGCPYGIVHDWDLIPQRWEIIDWKEAT